MDNVNNTLLADLNGRLTQPEAAQNNRGDIVQFNFKVVQVCLLGTKPKSTKALCRCLGQSAFLSNFHGC